LLWIFVSSCNSWSKAIMKIENNNSWLDFALTCQGPYLKPEGELNLRPWKEYTPRSQANTIRPTQVGFS
jgi:hypothetical protein